ncbi:MAG: trypsin-like peptidase domain-containing protein [Rhizobacter sp.]|nr:trypsin-like peptidase domain-containing protein [Rhizobacter sp.]
MKNMQEASEKICELKGNLVALEALVTAMMKVMPPEAQEELKGVFEQHAEVARTVLLHVPISEHSITAFEADVGRTGRFIDRTEAAAHADSPAGCDTVLLTVARVHTFEGARPLTAATGFFFEAAGRLYLVTCRHVFIDAASGHHPDRLEIELHTDRSNLTQVAQLSMPLYRNGTATWRETHDSAGMVDVAVLEIDPSTLPANCVLQAWTPAHIEAKPSNVPVGASLVVMGFPLGFHDTLHHLPVIRQGQVASSFGLRFQGQGYFLTDARTHRGTSGAPVLSHQHGNWKLLGIHAARLDMSARSVSDDESLGLNSAWYADVLARLTTH